jgi:hypothetical protein
MSLLYPSCEPGVDADASSVNLNTELHASSLLFRFARVAFPSRSRIEFGRRPSLRVWKPDNQPKSSRDFSQGDEGI